MSDTFCPAPWLAASSITNGTYRPCCCYNPTKKDTHWDDSLEENIKGLSHIRKALLAGEKPKECGRCWYLEKLGKSSIRDNMLELFSDRTEEILNSTDSKGNTTLVPEYFDMKLSNLCNLGCRMCAPNISSVLEMEIRKNPNEPWEKFGMPNYDKSWDTRALEKIKNLDIKILKFTGGEPFSNPLIIEFLESLNNKHEIELNFITNGLLIKDSHYKLFDRFKNIKLSVSCDGIGKVYEYIRWPGKWKKFDDQFNKIKSNIKDLQIVSIISVYNIRNVPNIVNYFKDITLYMSPLHTPEYLHPWVEGMLSVDFLKNINHNDVPVLINSYREFDKSLYERFKQQTEIQDRLRNQSWSYYNG